MPYVAVERDGTLGTNNKFCMKNKQTKQHALLLQSIIPADQMNPYGKFIFTDFFEVALICLT